MVFSHFSQCSTHPKPPAIIDDVMLLCYYTWDDMGFGNKKAWFTSFAKDINKIAIEISYLWIL